jgi:hypothetical protein
MAPSRSTQLFDDMDDSSKISFCREQVEAGHKRYLPLLKALTVSKDLILHDFRDADKEAQRHRKKYQLISQGAVWSGLAAVVIGLLEIVISIDHPPLLELPELAAAVTCVFFILWGTYSKPKENWLLARYQAENLRLLKFKTLLDSRFWCEDTEQFDEVGETPSDHVRNDVLAAIRSLKGLIYEDVAERAAQGVIPDVSEIHCPDSCPEELQEIIHYYCKKRLTTQMNYLAHHSGTEGERRSISHMLMSITFFISFGFILIHLSLDLGHLLVIVFANHKLGTGFFQSLVLFYKGPREATEVHPLIASVLVAIAVLGPAFVAGIKTYRASREFERNALRHRATLHSLESLNQEMSKAKNLSRKFRIARSCELILEFDSSEFMRLLREVEWYG